MAVFSCPLCPAQFLSTAQLEKHLRMELGIYRYRCGVANCPVRFVALDQKVQGGRKSSVTFATFDGP